MTRGKKYCTLYKTQVKLCVGDVSIKEANSLKLWHRQLGHVSEKGLQVLAKGNFIFEIKLALDTCVHYLEFHLPGKIHIESQLF